MPHCFTFFEFCTVGLIKQAQDITWPSQTSSIFQVFLLSVTYESNMILVEMHNVFQIFGTPSMLCLFILADTCAHPYLPWKAPRGVKGIILHSVNYNSPRKVRSHCSVKVLTVQVVLYNLLQCRHFQHYSENIN